MSFYNKDQMDQFKIIKEQVTEAKHRIEEAGKNIHVMDMGLRGYMLVPKDQMLYPYRLGQQATQPNLDTLGMILQAQNYPELEAHEKSKRAIREYQTLLDDMVELVSEGRADEALSILKGDPGYEVFMTYNEHLTRADAFEDQLYEKAQEEYQWVAKLTFTTQILFIALAMPMLFFVMHQINKASRNRARLFEELEASQRTHLFDDTVPKDSQDERTIINTLIENLGRASHFIKKISQGDYSVVWEGLTEENQPANQENLAGALVHMREQMKQMKQEDQQRLWTTEGLSKVAEITRMHQEDAEQLAEQLLSYLVNYTTSNQGSLFFLREDELGEASLWLTACYAYDKKRHAEKRVAIGQGLVGQTYLERKTLHLTQVPDQYVHITSGLGQATPSALLLIPLVFNDQVMGVLEIASFEAFREYEIGFLESVGEVIASAVATVRMNSQTKQLLEQSQEGTEALRAQEEEMERKAQEYEAVIEEQQQKIHQLEKIVD